MKRFFERDSSPNKRKLIKEEDDVPNNFFDVIFSDNSNGEDSHLSDEDTVSQLFRDYPVFSQISAQMLDALKSENADEDSVSQLFRDYPLPSQINTQMLDTLNPENADDDSVSQIFRDYPLPSPISTQMLDVPNQISKTGVQRGFGINEGAGTSFLPPQDVIDGLDVKSAVSLVEKRRRSNKKYDAEEISYTAKINQENLSENIRGASIADIIDVVKAIFTKILEAATKDLDVTDYIRFCIFHDLLDKPISTGILEVGSVTLETIMSRILKVIQSKDKIALDEGFLVDVVVIRRPSGGGRRKINIAEMDRLKKKSIVSIKEDDGFEVCCAKAILLSLAYTEKDPELQTLRHSTCNLLLRRALNLHAAAGVPEGPCGIPEIAVFEKHLKVQVVVISTEAMNKVIYKGPSQDKKVYLWLNGKHFDVIRSPAGFYGSKRFCQHCETPFSNISDHRCNILCHVCRTADCSEGDPVRCTDCDRNCRSEACFVIHKRQGICNEIYQCRLCCKVVLRRVCAKENHRCDHIYCRNCKKYVPEEHLCCMKMIKAKSPNEKILYFDFETDQSTNDHIVNFAVAHYFDGTEHVFEGYESLEKFCEFLFSEKHTGYTAIAHNMKGFDGQFILKWLLQQGQTPDVIPNGTKLMSISSKPYNICIIDSFNFLPMPLSKLPKTFGLEELKKGFFPHLFNRQENQSYVGDVPSEDFYSPDTMSSTIRKDFLAWYKKRVKEPFDFRKEMLEYCRSDVDILRRCCNEFREQFIQITKVDPFCYITIASCCMAYYKSMHIQPDTIAVMPSNRYVARTNYSMDSIRWLDYVAESEGIHIQHSLNGRGEKKIENAFVDGFCSQTNTVYQFQGCFYHGCNICFDSDIRNPINGCKMGDLFEKTRERSNMLTIKGYRLVEIWEHDFQKMKKENRELQNFLSTHNVCDRLNPRDSFYGGRTNAVQLLYEGQAKYIDFTSLYPWVNKYCRYPIGHPTVITKDFAGLEDYFGIVKCRVLPPRGLYHPVLPYRCNGKLMFPLCKTCVESSFQEKCKHTENQRAFTGTWVTEEVKKAKEMGYRILQIFEVYHFGSSSTELFQPYIDRFLKIKQEASGWPNECLTEEDKKKYIEEYLAKEQVQLNAEEIEVNPGRRSVAKLALNSFWGRFGMKCNKDRLSFVSSVPEFNKVLIDKTKEIKDIIFPSDEIAAITWRQKDEFVSGDLVTNIFIASFTTSYARLKLYSVMEKLGKDVLYYDTDSVIYKSDGSNDPELGNFLGDLTDELNGDIIHTFVSGGPKNYAFKTERGDTICKIRGFTLNYKNSLLLNFDAVERLILDMDSKVEVVNPSKISRDGKTRRVYNKCESKTYKIVYDKRVIQPDYSTLPYGY